MTTKRTIWTLKKLLDDLGPCREVMFDGERYNSRHLSNLLEKWHGSDAYTTEAGHILFDAGDGFYARIQTGIVKMTTKPYRKAQAK